MISFPRRTTLVLGAFASVAIASPSAFSGDLNRCAVYGQGFVDLGNGTCGRFSNSRIGETATGAWTNGGASSAGLRSDGAGMMPGAGDARHLRIQVTPEYR